MIFCVEDDASIRDLMVYTLQSTGFEAEGLIDGAELFAALSKKTPELILLDIMLPRGGWDIHSQTHTFNPLASLHPRDPCDCEEHRI